MSTKMLRCLNCGRVSPAGGSYCQFCGEAVDPALIAELQWLYGALNDLDTRIARGEGAHAISTLRNEYRDRYLAARRAPATEKAAAPVWPAAILAASGLPFTTPAESGTTTPAAPTSPAATPTPTPAPTAEPRPAGPIFSWQAFLSEQAIAIMMYMGGFLGLVAMLSCSTSASSWGQLSSCISPSGRLGSLCAGFRDCAPWVAPISASLP